LTSVNQEPPKQDPPGLITSPDASADLLANSLGDYVRIVARRIRSGESGALPVIIGLVVVVIYFQARNSLFLSPGNLVNLLIQGAPYIILGMAEVFVLLLGEIDLAVGFTGAVAAVITAWTVFSVPWWLAIILGLGTGAFIGLVFGLLPRNRILLCKCLVTRQIHLGLGEQALIVRKLAFGLCLRNLVRTIIDLRQKVSFVDELAFDKSDTDKLAADLGLHGDRSKRRYGAKCIDDDSDIAGAYRGGTDRLGPRILKSAARCRAGLEQTHSLVSGDEETEHNDGADDDPVF